MQPSYRRGGHGLVRSMFSWVLLPVIAVWMLLALLFHESFALCVANWFSSCYQELINPSAVSLPTVFVQHDCQVGHDDGNFSQHITIK